MVNTVIAIMICACCIAGGVFLGILAVARMLRCLSDACDDEYWDRRLALEKTDKPELAAVVAMSSAAVASVFLRSVAEHLESLRLEPDTKLLERAMRDMEDRHVAERGVDRHG